jgi:hypothetical protein
MSCYLLGEHADFIGHMQKRQKEKEIKIKREWLLAWISSHMKWQPQFRPTYLWTPSQQVTAYSVQAVQHQCKYKKLKIKKN